ncbi:MAG: YgcG family protein [Salinivirgaceae bacterium]
MKNIILILGTILLLNSCVSSQTNKKVSFVFDYENILQPIEKARFDSLFTEHEKKTTNEIVLVTTPDFGDEKDIIMFAQKFGEKVPVGKSNKDNGVIIVYSQNQRNIRIATGYGTEEVLKDEIAKRIIDYTMIPKFKEGKTIEGLWLGSLEIVEFLERPENEIKGKEYKQKK